MNIETIDQATLSELVEAGAISKANIVGETGGWSVRVKSGKTNKFLRTQKKRQIRLFKKMDSLVDYLKNMGISHFDVDATSYKPEIKSRPDRSQALRQAHEAVAHDKWFRKKVEEGIKLARSPDAVWIDHEDVVSAIANKKAQLLARAKGN